MKSVSLLKYTSKLLIFTLDLNVKFCNRKQIFFCALRKNYGITC